MTGKDRSHEAVVYVIPEKGLLIDEGMIFQPESVTLSPNQPRKVFLLVYVKMIEGGSTITITSDNESIHVSQEEITVNEADAIRHIVKYEIEVWGEGTGQDGVISAEHHANMALLGIRVRLKDETGDDKSRKGMFNEPEYSHEPKPLQRTAYSSEDGKVIIYVNFPSVQHYLGDKGQYRKSLPAQVFVADLVAERCFHEIAKRKVTVSGATLRPEAIPDRIQRDAFKLSREHGKKVHEVLVDKDLLIESRKIDE
ncbi:unnamed protein product [marine sediment metagenome]|uniref:Uncharacterized protein n=1 Tax=marine sediment metagenome TaxID=412755 RepID=X1L8B3_9ZZZZ